MTKYYAKCIIPVHASSDLEALSKANNLFKNVGISPEVVQVNTDLQKLLKA